MTHSSAWFDASAAVDDPRGGVFLALNSSASPADIVYGIQEDMRVAEAVANTVRVPGARCIVPLNNPDAYYAYTFESLGFCEARLAKALLPALAEQTVNIPLAVAATAALL